MLLSGKMQGLCPTLCTILPSSQIPRPLHELLVLVLLHLQLPLPLHRDEHHLAFSRARRSPNGVLRIRHGLDLFLISQLKGSLTLEHSLSERMLCLTLLHRLLSYLSLGVVDADDR